MQQAIPVSNQRKHVFNVGDYSIRLNFAGNALVSKIIPAFQHLGSNSLPAHSLDVFLIDSASTQLDLPQPPWQIVGELAYGEMWVSDGEDLKIKHQPTKNTLMMLNLKTNQAIYWVKDAEQIPYYESSAPLRLILHWWMSSVGGQLLHAAAVGLPEKGVLLVGKGGSGKSNTAISCLNSELNYVSDDYCLLTLEPQPTAHSLFSTAKLHFKDVDKHPYLKSTQYQSKEDEPLDEKALFFLYPELEERLTASFPIKAVIIPKVSNTEYAKLRPISASQAYLALAPSTIFQMHGNRRKSHENISSLLKQVQCFEMDLSTRFEDNSKAIHDFLNKFSN